MRSFLLIITIACSLTAFSQRHYTLDQHIGNSSIVALGETGHGYETINKAKADLLEFLRDSMSFRGVAFESTFTGSIVSYLYGDSLFRRTSAFLYPFWNTAPVNNSLKKFISVENLVSKPMLVGFDMQEDCRFIMLSQFLTEKKIIVSKKSSLLQCDSILSYYIGKNFSRKGNISEQEYYILLHHYELIETELRKSSVEAFQKKLLGRCLENRKWLCKYLTMPGGVEKMHFRDSLMAENVSWLKTEVFGEIKFVLWAADTHISKLNYDDKPKWMGEWLSARYPAQYAAISFRGGSGKPENSSVFDWIVYLGKLEKVNKEDWVTPCEK